MMRLKFLFILALLPFVGGCQTAGKESSADMKQAVKTIAESVSGQDLSDKDVNRLIKDLREDPEAQSAVTAIKESVSGEQAGRIKYSPATGKRYAPHLEYDPETGVKLEYVE